MALTLRENFRAIFYAPFYAAFALGAYAAEGLDLTVQPSAEPGLTVRAFLAGECDVIWGGPMRVMVAHDEDPDCGIVSFCEVVRRDPFFLVGRTPKPDFHFGDLLGRRVATVSEVPTPWLCLQHDLRRAGLDPAALDRAAGRTMAENAAALRSGEADVIQVFQPFAESLVAEGAGHIWYTAAVRGLTAYTSFTARRTLIEENPDDLLRLVRGMYRTQKWIRARGAGELAELIASYFSDLPRPLLAASIGRYLSLGLWNERPLMAREGYERLRDSCLSGGLIRRGCPFGHCVDMRLAEQAVREDPPSL